MWEITVTYWFHTVIYECMTEIEAINWEHALRLTGHMVTVKRIC